MPDDDFGDDEPEDAWHPEDPVAEQLSNLVRRAALVDRARDVRLQSDEPREVLEALTEVVQSARRRRGLDARTVLRVDHLEEDIVFVMARL